MALQYSLLLNLYRGRALVVEQMTPEQREALRVDTPLTTFLENALAQPSPRHVVLTGNAGDGKTFAALTSVQAQSTFDVIWDASADGSGDPPIARLAARLEGALSAGRRLLVAINRGQLERLAEHLQKQGGALAEFASEALAQSALRVAWSQQASSDLAVVDLGLFDSTADPVVDAMLSKASSVDLTGVSNSALAAATAACAALKEAHVRRWIKAVMAAVRAEGRHLTMRQLWSYVAFLVTGGMHENSTKALSVADTVGSRMFGYDGRRTPFESALPALDPARTPLPDVARWLLGGEAPAKIGALPGVGALASVPGGCSDGIAVARTAVVHDPSREPEDKGQDTFSKLIVALAKTPAWQEKPQITRDLLKGAYRVLGAWCSDPAFPAWQTLCYDSVKFDDAPRLASGEVNPAALRLALPRPPPRCEEALKGAWRPPYLWLAAEQGGNVSTTHALRLPPALFRALYRGGGEPIDNASALLLSRWLGRLPTSTEAYKVRIYKPTGDRAISRPLSVAKDDLTERIRIEEV